MKLNRSYLIVDKRNRDSGIKIANDSEELDKATVIPEIIGKITKSI